MLWSAMKLLHLSRQVLLQSFHIPRAVQKECTAVYQLLNHVVLAYIRRIVAGYEVCLVDQVGGLDRCIYRNAGETW